nr:ATP-binding protein [Mycolicibacterium agri]
MTAPARGSDLAAVPRRQSAIVLGPVGVGKTHLATALGHMAIRRRNTVVFGRADKLFTGCAPRARPHRRRRDPPPGRGRRPDHR